MNLDKKILDAIEREHIRMIPRWIFVGKRIMANALSVILLMGSVIASGMVLAVAMRNFQSSSIWILSFWALVLLTLVAWEYRQLMKTGFLLFYKSRMALIIGILCMNGALGSIFWGSGGSEKVESQLKSMPVFQNELETLEEIKNELDDGYAQELVLPKIKSDALTEQEPRVEAEDEENDQRLDSKEKKDSGSISEEDGVQDKDDNRRPADRVKEVGKDAQEENVENKAEDSDEDEGAPISDAGEVKGIEHEKDESEPEKEDENADDEEKDDEDD